ncbi:MAG: PhoD-like phosphatase N-terminal domain-containing protein, partial [Moraxellaceae bacterium]|nr:PhoD-like phosphatase N-terminal domain-containing protein [Moraxellaceae bacterium]
MTKSFSPISRRKLLALMGASAVTTLAVGCGSSDDSSAGAPNEAPDAQFHHGVASGEPLPDAVVIWTRVTPIVEAVPGSGLGGPVDVVWEVASDANFANITRQGRVTARAAHDHTIHIDVTGLQPATAYWYRFRAGSRLSPIGRTRTAPAANSSPESIRFGMVTCAEWEFGFFAAYRHLAERDDIAAVLHMGDYIYEFGTSYGPVETPGKDFGRI